MYKSTFKDLKRKCPPPDYSRVIDFDNEPCSNEAVKISNLPNVEPNGDDAFLLKQVKPVTEWEVFELKGKPGLLFVKNPFTWVGQRYWVCRCLQDYSQKPNRLNIDAHNELNADEDWWDSSQKKNNRSTALRKKLRWATMGYHHNWNTKVYSEDDRDRFPSDLASLSRFVARAVGFEEPFDAQAAIVNYYHLDSTLSGHTDHSEEHATAPLLSFSFGQTAIFLLGGQSIDDNPTAMYIRSGDIVIMSGYSRLCYHGIPKILKSTNAPWDPETALTDNIQSDLNLLSEESQSDLHLETKTESTADNPKNLSPKTKKRKLDSASFLHKVDCSKNEHLCNSTMWLPFKSYLELSRINMNVRQVLFAEQTALKSNETSKTVIDNS